jgi:hypothetical protein
VRKHLLASLFAGSVLLLALVPGASAQSAAAPDTAQGTPSITQNSPTGYYLFRANGDDGIHLRTHGPGAEHDFDAVLRTSGTFENVDVVKLEDGDRADVLDGGHELVLHFHTFDFTDGVNFTVRGSERLRLNLKLDGTQIPTDEIFLGADGHHPANNPFRIKV